MALSDKEGFVDDDAKVWFRFDKVSHAFVPVENGTQDIGSSTKYIRKIYVNDIMSGGNVYGAVAQLQMTGAGPFNNAVIPVASVLNAYDFNTGANLTGLVADTNRVVTLVNAWTGTQLVLKHASGLSVAANQFNLPGAADLKLGPGQGITLIHNGTSWQSISNDMWAILAAGGGLQYTGSVDVTGAITASTNITATAGAVQAGTTIQAGTTVTGGTGVIATTGDVTASVGGIVADSATGFVRSKSVYATTDNIWTGFGSVIGRAGVIHDTANGALVSVTSRSEEITLSLAGVTTDSTANLLLAGALVLQVTALITVPITGPTATLSLGDAGDVVRFLPATAKASFPVVGMDHWALATLDIAQAAAAKLRITADAIPTAGKVRVTVFQMLAMPPTS